MKKIFFGLCVCMLAMMASCSHKRATFAGTFHDEFGNKFVLNADYSATMELVNTDKIIPIKWALLDTDSAQYATIAFNGDDSYYILKDDRTMFRHADDLNAGRAAISIEYEEEK
jgi:hypothetical protein